MVMGWTREGSGSSGAISIRTPAGQAGEAQVGNQFAGRFVAACE